MERKAAKKEARQHVGIFCCYAHEDRPLLQELRKHLAPLLQDDRITLWADTDIHAGAQWDKEIQLHLHTASLILFLVSPDSIASNYGYSVEMQRALARHEAGEARIIPILLRPSVWRSTPFGELRALPSDTRPVTEWPKRDSAWVAIAQEIALVVHARYLQSATAQQPHQAPDAPGRDPGGKTDVAFVRPPAPHAPDQEEAGANLSEPTQNYEHRGQQHDERVRSVQHIDWQVPATFLSTSSRYIMGADIDRSHLTLALADLKEKTIEVVVPPAFDMLAGPNVCLKRIADEFQRLAEECHIPWEQVAGIGLATPGPLDDHLQKIVSMSQNAAQKRRPASQVPGWDGVDIPDILEHKLRLRKKIPIHLGRDANMGAIGESRYGAERGTPILVYIKVERGIGAGIIIHDRLYNGTGAAGELGHVVVIAEKGKMCACGNYGCLETVAATAAIVRAACTPRRFSARRATQTPVPARPGEKGDIGEVIQAAEHGDEASRAALKRAGAYIGRAIGGLINFFSPSMIVLDGDVVHSDDLLDALKHAAQEASLQMNWQKARIKLSLLDWPVVIGAIDNVIRRMSTPSLRGTFNNTSEE